VDFSFGSTFFQGGSWQGYPPDTRTDSHTEPIALLGPLQWSVVRLIQRHEVQTCRGARTAAVQPSSSSSFLACTKYSACSARWIKVPLGMKVGLGLGDIAVDGDPAPPRKGAQYPHFSAHGLGCHIMTSASAQVGSGSGRLLRSV